jgi:hypothetical protein
MVITTLRPPTGTSPRGGCMVLSLIHLYSVSFIINLKEKPEETIPLQAIQGVYEKIDYN